MSVVSSPLGLSHDFEPSQIDHLAMARLFDLPQNHPYTRTLLVLDLSRHLCITAGADTVARRERFRGLHALPADVLLAPGTDDQEIGKGITRVRALHGFTLPKRLLSHSLSP
jgi:hypothetical protein